MGFDFKEFEEYLKNMKQVQRDYNNFLKEFLLKCALEVLRTTKQITPVGETGNLKRGWMLGNVTQVGENLEIEIFNDVEYAAYVEYGHMTRNRKSWVEGRFMCTLSMEAVENKLNSRYKSALRNFLQVRGVL